jgi:acetoin:2,6-dichlorophenolindophenol oxidoreductase subunit alpha
LLHAITYRVKGHVSVDAAAYRDPAELAAALKTDPIARARQHYLTLDGAQPGTLDALEEAARAEVEVALARADGAPWPDPQSAYTDIQDTGAGQWR